MIEGNWVTEKDLDESLENGKKILPPWAKHGYSTYKHHGCRCPTCTKANTDQNREYQRRKRAGEQGIRIQAETDFSLSNHSILVNELAERVEGRVEVQLYLGRADIVNDTDVFEVEPHGSWLKGLKEVLFYARVSGLKPNLGLFNINNEGLNEIEDKISILNVAFWFYSDGWQLFPRQSSLLFTPF